MTIDTATLHSKLKEFFGFDSFKSDQERVIRHLVDGTTLSFLCLQEVANPFAISFLPL